MAVSPELLGEPFRDRGRLLVMRWNIPLILSLCLLASCSPAGRPPDQTGIEGQVLIGPSCPVEQIDQPCPDQPYPAVLSVFTLDGKRVAYFQTDPAGRFRLALAPGTYRLHPESPNGIPHASELQITVIAGQYTALTITYDSGIR